MGTMHSSLLLSSFPSRNRPSSNDKMVILHARIKVSTSYCSLMNIKTLQACTVHAKECLVRRFYSDLESLQPWHVILGTHAVPCEHGVNGLVWRDCQKIDARRLWFQAVSSILPKWVLESRISWALAASARGSAVSTITFTLPASISGHTLSNTSCTISPFFSTDLARNPAPVHQPPPTHITGTVIRERH
jgi:hypothetical protein